MKPNRNTGAETTTVSPALTKLPVRHPLHHPDCCCEYNPSIEHKDVVLASNCCPIHNYNPIECLAEPKCRCNGG